MKFIIKKKWYVENKSMRACQIVIAIVGKFVAVSVSAQLNMDLNRVQQFHASAAEHCDQAEMIAINNPVARFEAAFECGDELFATHFNSLDGVGANVGGGQRFTRSPRADRTGSGEWANHFPQRATGPNAEACTTCHNLPFEDGAGLAGLNVSRDPLHSGNPGQFINRNTPHMFSPGALQLLAQEMTTDLWSQVDTARAQACAPVGGNTLGCTITAVNTWPGGYQVDVLVTNNGAAAINSWSLPLTFANAANITGFWNATIAGGNSTVVTASNVSYNGNLGPGQSASFGIQGQQDGNFTPPSCPLDTGTGGDVTVELASKGVTFGSVVVPCQGAINTADLQGVDADLVVKPFQWKGNFASLRDFNRDASHNELGMQAVEITGNGFDGDGDGVTDEMGIGDQSALAIYLAAQPRPVTLLELNSVGVVQLTQAQINSINSGEEIFTDIGCADCHRPQLVVNNPVFTEPSQHIAYRDEVFPAGQDPIANLVNPANPISYNITQHQNNVVEFNGNEINLGNIETNAAGGAVVRLFGDLKRHDMGQGLAESIDETGSGASVWITKELWGVGSTAPYMHDGRASTLTEAILSHGGEAQLSRNAALALNQGDHMDLINFLDNLVLFKVPEE